MSINCSTSTFDISQFTSLLNLFSEDFPPHDKVLSRSYSEWLYLNNPFGPAKIVTAKEDEDGRWLGFMAMVPVRLTRRGEVRTGYFVVNVLVQRKQRGKNIFGMMIEKAMEHVKTERAIIMGHPNLMAYGAWERAAMHFQPTLKSYFVIPIPKFAQWNTSVLEVRKLNGLGQFIKMFNEQRRQSQELQVILSEDYLEWRYLRHPTNHYRLRAVSIKQDPVGFTVSRKVHANLNMLIDRFTLNGYMEASLSTAPLFTVALLPEALTQGCRRLWAVPTRKMLRFFCTDYEKPIGGSEVMRLGLSASDF
jgi:GNAT superfamily N-acetyltransferase